MWVSMARCPRCHQEAARRSRRSGVRDHLLGLAHFYPFRCQLCTTRFRAFQARQPRPLGNDRREYDRLLVKIPVTISAGATRGEGHTVDLSLAGCSLRTSATFAVGSIVQLRLQLGQAGDVEVQAAAVRTAGDDGLGLGFISIAVPDRERLSRYLGRFLRPSGSARRRVGGPRPQLVLAMLVGLAVIAAVLMMMGKLGGPPIR
jgi:hypothetical protein